MSTIKPQYVDKSIYMDHNPYGFIFNINHPLINHLYRQYKINHGLPGHFPVSDLERKRFEWVISKMIDEGAIVVR